MSFEALRWAIKQPVGGGSEKAVLWVLADHANKDTNLASCSVGTIAGLCGMSASAVREAITRLEKRGLVERRGSDIRRRYRILLDSGAGDAAPPPPKQPPNDGADPTGLKRDPTGTRRDPTGIHGQSGTDPDMNQSGADAPAAGADEDEKKTLGKTGKRLPQQRATRLNSDWEPSPQDIAWAKDNRPAVDWREEALKFRNYWLAKGGKDAAKTNWHRTWQNWIINAAKYAQRRPGGSGGGATPIPGTVSGEPWALRLKAFAERKFWRPSWGPPPGSDTCRVPPELLQRHGYRPAAVAASLQTSPG
jgi:hypothetical protein